MIISNDKYLMSEEASSYYSVTMKLLVRNFQKTDPGGYKCISKNSIGDAEGNIRLYGKDNVLTEKCVVLLKHYAFFSLIKPVDSFYTNTLI